MAAIESLQRPERVFVGSELEVLLSDLDFQRATLLWKCEGLDDAQLRSTPVAPSTLSLLGLLRHATGAERHWFQEVPFGVTVDPQYFTEWTDAESSVQTVLDNYSESCDESRRVSALVPLDRVFDSANFGPVNFRFILVHMVEEYARHCGHADLIRESIDGAVGE